MAPSSLVLLSGLVATSLVGSAHAEHRVAARAAKVAAIDTPPRSLRAQLTDERGLTAPSAEPRPTRRPAFLEATDVTAQVAPHAAALERCYLAHITDGRHAGHLDILLEIARDGRVRSVATAAGDLSPRATQQVTTCIRAIAQAVQFPERRNDTTVVLPFYFQKTEAPGAGPQLSCWSAKGCR